MYTQKHSYKQQENIVSFKKKSENKDIVKLFLSFTLAQVFDCLTICNTLESHQKFSLQCVSIMSSVWGSNSVDIMLKIFIYSVAEMSILKLAC